MAMVTLADRLRAERRHAGWTLGYVAGEARISVSYLSDIERGVTLPSLPILERIAAAFNLSVGELLVNVRIVPEQEGGA